MKKLLLISFFTFLSCCVMGEDIDLYLGDNASKVMFRPQVLIIFDNSGSMADIEVDVKDEYKPNTTYPAYGSDNSLRGTYTYFIKGGIDGTGLPVPDNNETRRFREGINSCNAAVTALAKYGFYTGYIREYEFSGNSGTWEEIPDNSGANIDVIDCQDDILANDPTNYDITLSNNSTLSIPDGFPADNQGKRSKPIYHLSSRDAALDGDAKVNWSGQLVTLYTDNYLRWAHNLTPDLVDSTKLALAQSAVTEVLETTKFADYGLQVFNANAFSENEHDGGRVVFGIKDTSNDETRNKLVDIINNQIDAKTNTPLCESMYEASLYFRGLGVEYGDDDGSIFTQLGQYDANTPPRDESIESGSNYVSPYHCNDTIYVILITDGAPTLDNAADTNIAKLPGIGDAFTFDNGKTNYLPALAKWMATNDLNANIDGDQVIKLFTVGFGDASTGEAGELLEAAAANTGGKYYPVVSNDRSELVSAIQGALAGVAEQNGSLTSASVASNNFDRTETLDSVYYAMFSPESAPRWQGNLKKYKVVGDTQKDANNNDAVDAEGNFNKGAQSFWSSTKDGNDPTKGGVAEHLRNNDKRKLLTNFSNQLPELTLASARSYYSSDAALATVLGVTEEEIDNTLNWAFGIDVDDENDPVDNFKLREDVFGDPLHSKPLVVNYGGDNENSQDIRILIGTNSGVLHMFDDQGSSIDESWAFMPKEFFRNIKPLRDNFSSTPKVHGLDGAITSYIRDLDGDGKIEAKSDGSGDLVWIFFGARRGGSIYYALDISFPDAPKILWQKDRSSLGNNLGQSWSKPKIAFSKLNVVNNVPYPVVLFGAGYDINKDKAGIGTKDDTGVGAYMLDAETGKLLWQLSSAASSATNTLFAGEDSIPGEVATLDSDSDGFIDRIYLADTGGNIWRVDMPGKTPNSSETPWQAIKLAELGSRLEVLDDRRFFYEPSIARTFITDTLRVKHTDANGNETETIRKQERPYDAILISSGDRATPLDKKTVDRLYMIKDENIRTQSFGLGDNQPIPTKIVNSDLSDFTSNPFSGNLTTQQRQQKELEVSAKSGWYVDLNDSGEKGTSSAIAIDGTAFFTSFIPPDEVEVDLDNCRLLIDGGGFLYAIDLALGTEVFNFTQETDDGHDDKRAIKVGEQFLGSPTLIVTPKPGQKETESSSGNLITGRIIVPVGFKLRTSRLSLSVEEQE